METVNSSLKIRYVVVDTITGGEVTDLYIFESEAKAAIKGLEKNDKICGCYEKDTYKVSKVETI